MSRLRDRFLSGASETILALVFTGVMIAIGVISIVFIIQRFYRGLLGEEGYLMFTLPVTPTQLILSKLITSVAVIVISGIGGVLSILLITTTLPDLGSMFVELGRFLGHTTVNAPAWWGIMAEVFVLVIVTIASGIMFLYMCMAIGHLAKRHRVALSVIAYILLSSSGFRIISFIGDLIDRFNINITIHPDGSNALQLTSTMLLVGIAATLVVTAVYFLVTDIILKKKLNLE